MKKNQNISAVIIQCRQSSTRLKKKLLLKIGAKKIIDILLNRVKTIDVDYIICAVAKEKGNKSLINAIKKNGVKIYEGSKNNVLSRYYNAAKKFKVTTIIRITSDCPLIDPKLVNDGMKIFKDKKLDHLCNNLPPTWPHGLDFEIFNFNALKKSLKGAKSQHEKEHVTPNLRKNRNLKKFNITNKIKIKKYYRWTLDTKLDYIFLKKLFKARPELNYNFDWYNSFVEHIDSESNSLGIVPDSNINIEYKIKYLNYMNFFCHGSAAFSIKALQDVSGYDASLEYSQDFDLWLKFLTNKKKLHFDERILYQQRITNESISIKNLTEQTYFALKIVTNYPGHNKIFNGLVWFCYNYYNGLTETIYSYFVIISKKILLFRNS